MKKLSFAIFLLGSMAFLSCSNDDDNNNTPSNNVIAPATYSFERNGVSTVSYSGQTTRIQMAEELIDALKDDSKTEAEIDGMFDHQAGDPDFSTADLNDSGKNIRDKTAASKDYFSANSTDATAIKAVFDSWIASQVNDVYPNWLSNATAGNAGQIQELGGSTRYVNGKGLELNQAFTKSLIGGLMTDQILNNYIGSAVLDAGDNVGNNNNDVLDGSSNYTTMEHKWDEAFGYLYGLDSATAPALNTDNFLSKYLSRVEGDSDFTGIAADVYDAFKLGRAAIVAKNYTVRDQQADILREKISMIIGIRAVYYLQQGKATIGTDNGSAFHDLSEGYGFIYSLQFTRNPNTNAPYFTKTEVDSMISQLMTGNGFWDVTAATLDSLSDTIAAKFAFTVTEAGS
jgi:hypothetical protein